MGAIFAFSGGGLCDLKRRGAGGAAASEPCRGPQRGRAGAGAAPRHERPLSVSPAGSAGTPTMRSPSWRRSSSAAGERPLRGSSRAHRALQGSTRFRCSRTWAGRRQEAGHLLSLNRITAPAEGDLGPGLSDLSAACLHP